jgi:hypothetical protein
MFNFFNSDSDFVSRVRYYKPERLPGKKIEDFSDEDNSIMLTLQSIGSKVCSTQYITQMNEKVHLVISDADNLVFTVLVSSGKFDVIPGWNISDFPTLSLTLKKENLTRFDEYVTKGYLNDEEIQRSMYAIALPAIESFYHSEMVNKLENISMLRLHKLMHLELRNPKNYNLQGVDLTVKMTVMNVLGQFIILPGWVGVAPIIFSVDWKEAVEYYTLLKYKLPHAKSLSEKKDLFQAYMSLRGRTLRVNPKYKHIDN